MWIVVDIDAFYAQCAMLKDPRLRHVPMGVRQKGIIVTSNYAAREKGVGKLISLAEAKRLCPELEVVPGEDLALFRRVSERVFSVVREVLPRAQVSRLGMDEFCVYLEDDDVLEMRRVCRSDREWIGHVFSAGDLDSIESDAVASGGAGVLASTPARRSICPSETVGAVITEYRPFREVFPDEDEFDGDKIRLEDNPGFQHTEMWGEEDVLEEETAKKHIIFEESTAKKDAFQKETAKKDTIFEESTTAKKEESKLPPDVAMDHGFVGVTVLHVDRMGRAIGLEARGRGWEMLRIGSWVAGMVRREIRKRVGVTTCAGIGMSKLSAKLAVALNKPNLQTTLFSSSVAPLLARRPVRAIPGAGSATCRALAAQGVLTCSDLVARTNTTENLHQLARDTLLKLNQLELVANLARGIDDSKPSDYSKPLSISDEDSFGATSIRDLGPRLDHVTTGLARRIIDDSILHARHPRTLRVTTRKSDVPYSNRRSKQSRFPRLSNMDLASLSPALLQAARPLLHQLHPDPNTKISLLNIAVTDFEPIAPTSADLRAAGQAPIDTFLRQKPPPKDTTTHPPPQHITSPPSPKRRKRTNRITQFFEKET